MIAIIDYGTSNLASIANMGRRVGGEFIVTADPAVIAIADKIILPGVGAFGNCMKAIDESGLIPVLNRQVLEHKIPVLGVCLGLQLFTRGSEEGGVPGLNWIAAETRRFKFPPEGVHLKIPHMGWNYIETAQPSELLNGLPPEPRFYFVHSYHLVCDEPTDVLAWTTYGYRFASVVRRGNIWGTQFHPEKSHKFGLALLKNFLALS